MSRLLQNQLEYRQPDIHLEDKIYTPASQDSSLGPTGGIVADYFKHLKGALGVEKTLREISIIDLIKPLIPSDLVEEHVIFDKSVYLETA